MGGLDLNKYKFKLPADAKSSLADWYCENKALSSAVGAVFIVAVVGMLIFLHFYGQSTPQQSSTVPQRDQYTEEVQASEQLNDLHGNSNIEPLTHEEVKEQMNELKEIHANTETVIDTKEQLEALKALHSQ